MKLLLLLILTLVQLNSICASKSKASALLFPSYPTSSNYEDEETKAKNRTPTQFTLQDLEHTLRSGIEAAMKQLLPFVLRASEDVKLSGRCMAGVFRFAIGVQKLEEWAVKMIDAAGKPPGGLFQGTTMALGHFDECVDISVGPGGKYPATEAEERFHGKYCTLEIKLPQVIKDAAEEYLSAPSGQKGNTSIGQSKTVFHMLGEFTPFLSLAAFRLGICLPSLCNEADLGSLVHIVVKQLGVPINVLHCQEKPVLTFTTEQMIIIPVLGSIVTAVILATIAGIYYSRVSVDKEKRRSKWRRLAIHLSLIRNIRKLFTVDDADKHPMPAFRGLLFITVSLNVFAHSCFMPNILYFFRYSSLINVIGFMKQITFVVVGNGSNGIGLYFFVAGFMITYVRWRMPLPTVRLDLMKLLVKPYVRMVLLQLLAISLFLCLPMIGYGPFWKDFMGPPLQTCRDRWWANMFFIQNFWNTEDTCLYHTWLFAVLMQLYVISVPILWLLIKKPNFGIALIIAVIVTGMATVGAIVFVKELPGAFSFYTVDAVSAFAMFNSLFTQVYDHIGTFCIGILTGYSLGRFQSSIKLKPIVLVIGWTLAVATYLAVTFCLYEYREINDHMSPSGAILYAMVNRNLFALVVSWIIVAALTGNATCLVDILSWKALVPLYRISFMAFAVHALVIYFHVAILRQVVYISQVENVMRFLGYLLVTYFLAIVCYLFFQAPYMYLESLVLGKCCKTLPRSTSDTVTDSLSSTDHSLSKDSKKPHSFMESSYFSISKPTSPQEEVGHLAKV